MKSTRTLLVLLMVLGSLAVCATLAVVLFNPDGPLADLIPGFREKDTMRVYLQVPPVSSIGEDARLIITVKNTGSDILSIDELRLPNELVKHALIKGIFPGSLTQTGYEDSNGYQIGFMLAPDEHVALEVVLEPKEVADILGDVQVVAGEQEEKVGFRMVFEYPIAKIPTATATFTPTASPTPAPTFTPTPVTIPYQAVVKLTAKLKSGSRFRNGWAGSGTIISPNGLILTNAHLVSPPRGIPDADAFVISLSLYPDQEPIDMYYAEIVDVDESLDLALIRITQDIDFKPVDPSSLNLPTVNLGDSNSLNLGDPLYIVGFPAIGGDTVTLTQGDVGGFTGEKKVGDRAYIKTAASITGGMSGGMAMDKNGYMVGVPTQIGYGGEDELLDCRVIVDTNGDGDVDQQDVCVPTGGFINALRPINLAMPMIQAAMGLVTPTAEPAAATLDTEATLASPAAIASLTPIPTTAPITATMTLATAESTVEATKTP